MHNQRRRLEVRGAQMRRPFPVHPPVRPGRSLKFPLGKPELLGSAIRRLRVEYAVVRYDALETVGMAEDPVGHVSAVACSQRALALFINEGIMLLRIVKALH